MSLSHFLRVYYFDVLQEKFQPVRSPGLRDPRIEVQRRSVRTQKEREFELSPSDIIWNDIIIAVPSGPL
jgi:hypothetical protein